MKYLKSLMFFSLGAVFLMILNLTAAAETVTIWFGDENPEQENECTDDTTHYYYYSDQEVFEQLSFEVPAEMEITQGVITFYQVGASGACSEDVGETCANELGGEADFFLNSNKLVSFTNGINGVEGGEYSWDNHQNGSVFGQKYCCNCTYEREVPGSWFIPGTNTIRWESIITDVDGFTELAAIKVEFSDDPLYGSEEQEAGEYTDSDQGLNVCVEKAVYDENNDNLELSVTFSRDWRYYDVFADIYTKCDEIIEGSSRSQYISGATNSPFTMLLPLDSLYDGEFYVKVTAADSLVEDSLIEYEADINFVFGDGGNMVCEGESEENTVGDEQEQEQIEDDVEETDEESGDDFDDLVIDMDFNDLPDSHWASLYVHFLVASGAIEGYGDGSFKPDNDVTRAEFLKMAFELFDFNLSDAFGEELTAKTDNFSDVSAEDWFYDYVTFADFYDVVEGFSDGSFGPEQPVTRAEALKIAIEIANLAVDLDMEEILSEGDLTDGVTFSDVSENDWFYDYVLFADLTDIIDGFDDGTFKPATYISRAEASKVLYNVYTWMLTKMILEEMENAGDADEVELMLE